MSARRRFHAGGMCPEREQRTNEGEWTAVDLRLGTFSQAGWQAGGPAIWSKRADRREGFSRVNRLNDWLQK